MLSNQCCDVANQSNKSCLGAAINCNWPQFHFIRQVVNLVTYWPASYLAVSSPKQKQTSYLGNRIHEVGFCEYKKVAICYHRSRFYANVNCGQLTISYTLIEGK